MTDDPKKTITQPSMSAADPMQRPEGKPTTKFDAAPAWAISMLPAMGL